MHKSLNWLLTFGQSHLFTMTNSIVLLATGLKIEAMGGKENDIAVAGLAFGVTNTLTPLVAGWLSDHIGRQATMLVGYALSATACVLLMTADELSVIPYLVMLHTTGSQGIWSVIEAWLADRSIDSVSRQMTIYNLGWSSGAAIGFMYTGFFKNQDAGFQTVYMTAAGIILFLAIVRLLIADRAPATAMLELHDRLDPKPSLTPVETIEARGRLYCVWLASFGAWFFHAVIMWIFTYDAKRMGISEVTIGNLQATVTWAEFVTFIAIIFYSRWYLSTRLRFASQAVAIGGIVLFTSGMLLYGQGVLRPQVTVGIIGTGLATFGVGLAAVYSASLIASVTDAHARGARAGIHEMLVGLGSISAPWVSGKLMEHFSQSTVELQIGRLAAELQIRQLAAYGIGAGVMVLALLAQTIVLRQVRVQVVRLETAQLPEEN
jgi:MFS family permease